MILVFEYSSSNEEYGSTEHCTFDAESVDVAETALLEVIEYNNNLWRMQHDIADAFAKKMQPISNKLQKIGVNDTSKKLSDEWIQLRNELSEKTNALGEPKLFCGYELQTEPEPYNSENWRILTLDKFVKESMCEMVKFKQ